MGSEKWQFLLTFSNIYADVRWVGGSNNVQKCAEVIEKWSLIRTEGLYTITLTHWIGYGSLNQIHTG